MRLCVQTLALVLLLWNRVRGLHSSGVLFLFWLSLSIAGAPQLYSEITEVRMYAVIYYSLANPALAGPDPVQIRQKKCTNISCRWENLFKLL